MKQAVAIAGAGCVLPSGWGVESFWAAATEGRSAITALNARRFSSEDLGRQRGTSGVGRSRPGR